MTTGAPTLRLAPGNAPRHGSPSHHFHSGEELEQTLLRYVRLYNTQLPQATLKGRTPIEALKDWHRERPDVFRKRLHNHLGGGVSKSCWREGVAGVRAAA